MRRADAAVVFAQLEPISLLPGQVIARAGEAWPWVIFPCRPAVVALVASDSANRSAEAVSIGGDGVATPELLDMPESGHLRVQIPGNGYRIDIAGLAALEAGLPELRDALAAHRRVLLVRALQGSVCAALHPVEARVSRWLLTAQDRVGLPDLPVTQELLAEMLGVRRTTVTRVIAQLSDRGLIQHRRSRVIIIDRPGLEAASCGCHAALLRRLQTITPGLQPLA